MWRSVGLIVKTLRFETSSIVIVSLGVTAASLICSWWLDSYGLASGCISAWIGGNFTGDCASTVQAWAGLSSEAAGRLLLASGVAPVAAGLAAGVALVGGELEGGTAELTWSFARSRWRWFSRRAGVLGLLVVVFSAAVAIASDRLEGSHTAGGLWISPFADADLFGLPVVARSLLAFGVGTATGAAIGRTLPAFLVGTGIVLAVLTATSVAQPAFARLPTPGIGGPGYVAAYLSDPDVDVRFITSDARMLTTQEAIALVPPGRPPGEWLQANLQLFPLGISAATTFRWQAVISLVYGATGGLALAVGALISLRRRPLLN
jgi:hypothetical protein